MTKSKKGSSVNVRFDKDTLSRIDFLIEKKKFDSRSQFIRRATNEYLDLLEPKILA